MEKIESHNYSKFAMYLVLVVLLNLVGLTLFFRIDLTSNGLYSLSSASKNVVRSLGDPLTIKVFFTKNLPAPYNNVERYLYDLLEEYQLHSNKKLNYQFFNVSASEGSLSEDAEKNRQLAQSYGIQPVNVQKFEQDEAKIQRAYMGMVMIHGDIIEKIPSISDTEGLEYKITTAIQKMNNKISALINLEENIKVTLVQSSSLKHIAGYLKLAGLDNLRSDIEDLVEKQKGKTYNKLQFNFIDPADTMASSKELSKFERFGLQWPELKDPGTGAIIPAGKGILGIGISYKDKSLERQLLAEEMKITDRGLEKVYRIGDMKELETFINDNIDSLIDINEDVGYLSSHDTPSLASQMPPQMRMFQQEQESSLTKFNTLLSNKYSVKQVDLEKDEIPDSIDTLIIAGAKKTFNEYELFKIDQFLMKGRSLALFLDSFNEVQQNRQQMYGGGFNQPMYIPIRTGIEKLLFHYGASIRKSFLLDEVCYVNKSRESGEVPIYFAPLIKSEFINHDFSFMKNIKELIGIKLSPLEVDEEKIKANELKITKLLSSSPKAWEMENPKNLIPMFIQPPTEDKDKKSFAISYLIEGKFPSYFADKPVPEKPAKEEEPTSPDDAMEKQKKKEEQKDQPPAKVIESKVTADKAAITKGKPGRIFLIGSSEILKDNIIDEEGNSPNAIFLLNTLDYLNNQEGIAMLRGKNQKFNPLKDTTPFVRSALKIFNIGGLPLGIIVMGLFIWVRRRVRRKQIQTMFSQNKQEN